METPAESCSPTPETDLARERPCYRDDEQFKKALDAAADRIRKAQGPDVIGNVVWWGLIAFQATLLIGDWAFDLKIRHTLIDGVDIVNVLWALLAGMVVFHLAWLRHQHGRIVRNRLCLDCGQRLLGVTVDDAGSGACPSCDREFNLGEYRRPMENRGRAFSGYLDADHFDKTMYAVAEHLRSTRGFRLEGSMLTWAWTALGISWGLSVFFELDVLEWVPDPIPRYGVCFLIMILWTVVYGARVRSLRPAIVDRRLCFNCGYSLLGTIEDEHGLGRCPECGTTYHAGQYDRPEA